MKKIAMILGVAALAGVVAAAPARAEWDPGMSGFRAFDILDIYDSPIGEMIVTGSAYSGSTNLTAGSEPWHWDSSVWIDHFRIEANGASDHSIDTPFQRYAHSAFPQSDGSMPSLRSSPAAWRLTPIGAGDPVALDAVVTRNASNGDMVWAARAAELNASRRLDLEAGETMQFEPAPPRRCRPTRRAPAVDLGALSRAALFAAFKRFQQSPSAVALW